MSTQLPVLDARARPLADLRVSVTDRCNFRCRYCMPRESFGRGTHFLPRSEILTFEEIARTVRVFVRLGVRKIRLTGGEPLLRAELDTLVRLIASQNDVEIALTTNGSLLDRFAERLRTAGLDRVTVSLDSLDEDVFRQMADTDVPLRDVLRGIEAAVSAGLGPVKINAVVRRGVNDHSVVDLARYTRERGLVLRFIEYMDVGTKNDWAADAVSVGRDILARISAVFPVEPVDAAYRGEVARRYRYRDGGGEIGFITSVSKPFCGDCTRARLSAEGRLYTCLFATTGVDLRRALRCSTDDAALERAIVRTWSNRADRYSELRRLGEPAGPRIEMSYIGG